MLNLSVSFALKSDIFMMITDVFAVWYTTHFNRTVKKPRRFETRHNIGHLDISPGRGTGDDTSV